MLDVPHFIAPMMIRFGSATGSASCAFRQEIRAWYPADLPSDRSDAVGWEVMPRLVVMKPDERACGQRLPGDARVCAPPNSLDGLRGGSVGRCRHRLRGRSHAGRPHRYPAPVGHGRASRGARRRQPAPGLPRSRSPRHPAPLGCEPWLAPGCRGRRSSRRDKHLRDHVRARRPLCALDRRADRGASHPAPALAGAPADRVRRSDGPFARRGRGSSTRRLRARSVAADSSPLSLRGQLMFGHRERSFSSSWACWSAFSSRLRS